MAVSEAPLPTVLVIDDEDLIRWSLRQVLTQQGYDVLLAENGEDGLALSQGRVPELVLLDLKLPDVDGLDLLTRFLSGGRHASVIVMTAYGSPSLEQEVRRRGAAGPSGGVPGTFAHQACTGGPLPSGHALTLGRSPSFCPPHGAPRRRPGVPFSSEQRPRCGYAFVMCAVPAAWPDLLIFDLDGTLIDSKQDLANSLNQALRERGMKELDREEIYSYVGNGVYNLIERSVHAAGGDDVHGALSHFMTVYDQRLLEHTRLYDGIVEVLDHFHDVPLALITNKSMRFTRPILVGLGVVHRFRPLLTRDSFPECKPHPGPVQHCVVAHGVRQSHTWMIGDGATDIVAGRSAGVHTCGCLYGFRSEEELTEAGADALISAPGDLLTLFPRPVGVDNG
jgi:phosphoglycolate phosphatase